MLEAVVRAVESYPGRFLLWVACVLLAAVLYAKKTATPDTWDAGDWEAVAAVLTAFIALAAISVAVVQLRDARELRWEQAQPYVTAFLQPDPTDPRIVYMVMKNFGTTMATDLQLGMGQPPKSKHVGGGDLKYPRTLPALVPGQEWRTFWDFSPARFIEKLNDRHTLHINFTDSRGKEHLMEPVLDWEPPDLHTAPSSAPMRACVIPAPLCCQPVV